VVCDHCEKTTRTPRTEEIAGQFGPQLTGLIAYLTVVCRMPRRVVEALLAQVPGIEISLGSIQKCREEASQAVAGACQELEQMLKDEPVLNVDETGWRTNGDKRFLGICGGALRRLHGGANPRQRSVNPPAGAVFQGISVQRPVQCLFEVSLWQSAILLSPPETQSVGDCGVSKSSAVERFRRDALAEHARLFRLWRKFRSDQIDCGQLLLRSRSKSGLSPWPGSTWTAPIAKFVTSPWLCSSTRSVCLLSSSTKKLNPPTTAPNGHSALVFSGAKSASVTAAPLANRPRLVC
jgi:hypothetical protein